MSNPIDHTNDPNSINNHISNNTPNTPAIKNGELQGHDLVFPAKNDNQINFSKEVAPVALQVSSDNFEKALIRCEIKPVDQDRRISHLSQENDPNLQQLLEIRKVYVKEITPHELLNDTPTSDNSVGTKEVSNTPKKEPISEDAATISEKDDEQARENMIETPLTSSSETTTEANLDSVEEDFIEEEETSDSIYDLIDEREAAQQDESIAYIAQNNVAASEDNIVRDQNNISANEDNQVKHNLGQVNASELQEEISTPGTPSPSLSSIDGAIKKAEKLVDKAADSAVTSAADIAIAKLAERVKNKSIKVDENGLRSIAGHAIADFFKANPRHNKDISEDEFNKIFDKIWKEALNKQAIYKNDSKGRKIPLTDKEKAQLESTFKEAFRNELLKHGVVIKQTQKEKVKEQTSENNQSHDLEGNDRNAQKAGRKSAQKTREDIPEGILKIGKAKERRLMLQLNQERGIEQARKAEKQHKKFLERLKTESEIRGKDYAKYEQNLATREREAINETAKAIGVRVKNSEGVIVKVKVEVIEKNNPKGTFVSNMLLTKLKTIYNTSVWRGS